MGIADSPLRDRVIFVEGVPRSGTSWVISLLALHPDIAAVSYESHLFDIGVDRLFLNHEIQDRRFLRAYVSRAELVDVVRDACDGVFMRMRDATKPGASFVAEKTPVPDLAQATASVTRKLECYPDAWYIHIVRDGHEVARSLARMPWMGGRSEAECFAFWQRSSAAIRDVLSGGPRYREVSHADLVADPAAGITELMAPIGIATDPGYLQTVVRASSQSYDGWPGARAEPAARRPIPLGVADVRRLAARALRRVRRAGAGEKASDPWVDVRRFMDALRQPTAAPLETCTTPAVTVTVTRATADGVGQRTATGDDARALLADAASEVFEPRIVREAWAWSSGSWRSAPGRSFTGILSGPRGDGSNIDLHLTIGFEESLVGFAWLFIALRDPS